MRWGQGEEGKDDYMEGERVLPPVRLQNGLQRGLVGLSYRPWKSPSADYQCLATLSVLILYTFIQGVGLEVASDIGKIHPVYSGLLGLPRTTSTIA